MENTRAPAVARPACSVQVHQAQSLPRRVLRYRDAFDAVYGASAGAINATYFLTGQREGVDIYAEDIANKTFCDLGRLVGRNAGASERV